MAQTVADVMTANPVTVESEDTAAEAAMRMAANDAGDVIVLANGKVCGIVTDRDIAIRLVAQGLPSSTQVSEIVSDSDVLTVDRDMALDQAIELMRAKGVRRLPVVHGGSAIGVVSLGDVAIERDPQSAVADISAARGNT
ncbi:MAG: CBS domain-containing protein [Streptosporangiaceae bacterium]